MEERLGVKRCHRYSEYSYEAKECKGADLTKQCYRCGKEDHKLKECKEAPERAQSWIEQV
ncbi:unnamed protein product [Ceutorhynchus assimilis]|uniref:CCHC-type domain-containing protein n=1 Tax=Ceutorhynchus assimilis TaxID=467358 RepID=A0A9N9MKL0_9CUCU|nr:unnamed protein product [Ceutorhynchus assimilis]